MKPRIKSTIWNTRKQKKQPIRKTRKRRIKKKNEDSISILWDNFKRSNICNIVVAEGEEKEQEIGNLSENIMKENFPYLVREIDMQVQEAQSPKQDGYKEAQSKTHHN